MAHQFRHRISFPIVNTLIVCPLFFLTSNANPSAKREGGILTNGRPPYFQCPSLNDNIISTYPLLTNPQCSQTFTYCASQVAIPGKCPWGMIFTPRILACDGPIPEHCYRDEDEVIELRAIEDDPSYNQCNRRPCNFFPNGDADDNGATYIFCQFGQPRIRRCPHGTAFCVKKKDCVDKAEAHVFNTGTCIEGIRESGNPIPFVDEIPPEISLSENLTMRGTEHPVSIPEPENDIVIVRDTSQQLDIPLDAEWSDWYICPHGTFIVIITHKRVTCLPIAPGEHPEKDKMRTELPIEKKVRAYFPSTNCDKGRGGVVTSFKMNKYSKLVEFYCSNDYPAKGARFCPATKAVCGMSYMRGPLKNVANVKVKCCPVPVPKFIPEEKLLFVSHLDNIYGETEITLPLNYTYGIDIPMTTEAKVERSFYVSLGFTADHLWKTIEQDLQKNMKCEHNNGTCYFPWENYKMKNRRGVSVSDQVPVPPKEMALLNQVYAQLGYFQVFTNYFVRTYEENKIVVKEAMWQGSVPEYSKMEMGSLVSVPVLAINTSLEIVNTIVAKAEEVEKTLCPFLNLTAATEQHWEDRRSSWIENPTGKDQGDWGEWKECAERHFVDSVEMAKDGGVTQVKMNCKAVRAHMDKSKRSVLELDNFFVHHDSEEKTVVKRAANVEPVTVDPAPKTAKPKVKSSLKVLDFLQPGASKGSLEGKEGCSKGGAIGFQTKSGGGGTGDFRLICSCPDDGKGVIEGDGWSEPQVCDPFHAITAMSPRFSDQGLTNFKIRCTRIPAAAAKCKPRYERLHVAICSTDERSNSCIFKSTLGVTYSLETEHRLSIAHWMNSIGYSLPCSYRPLKENFRKFFPNEAVWKDSFWRPMTTHTSQIFQLGQKSKTEIYQTVGRCGAYIVYTNRFVRIENGNKTTEQEFATPLPPGPPPPPCLNIRRQHDKKQGTTDIPTSKSLPTSKIITVDQIKKNRTYYIQRPPRWDPSPDAIWSPWILCNVTSPNNITHITDIQAEGILCQMVLSPGEPIPQNSTKFVKHKIKGLSLSTRSCTQGGGVIVGFKKTGMAPVNYYCSSTKPKPTSAEEWCPPKTAACGLSILYNPVTLETENVKLRCCQVYGPIWADAHERLALIGTFDNSQGITWQKFKFETGFDGAIIHKHDNVLAKYWLGLGYDWENTWFDIEEAIIYNVTCYKTSYKTCLFGWPDYKLSTSELYTVQKKILVPPRSVLKLYQIYAQVSFYRIYVPRFVELIEDTAHNAVYEELRAIRMTDEVKEDIANRDPLEGRANWSPPTVIVAENITATEYATKLLSLNCVFHNLTGRKAASIPDMEGGDWRKCPKDSFLNKVEWVRKEGKGSSIIDVKTGCVNSRTVTKSGKYIEADDQTSGLVEDGSVPSIPDRNKYVCKYGVYVGLQPMTDEVHMICSCPPENQKKEIFVLSDGILCEPLHALQGILPHFHTANDKVKLDKFCAPVPNLAEDCKPKQLKRILVAKCSNKKDKEADCAFKTNIGITYNLDSENNIRHANILEGVGHTVPCVAPVLAKNFQNTLKTPLWREDFWIPLSEVHAKTTNLRPNADMKVYQIVGSCGIYVVHTNRFILVTVGGSKEEQELDLPIYEIPDLEKCWTDPKYKKKNKGPKVESILEL